MSSQYLRPGIAAAFCLATLLILARGFVSREPSVLAEPQGERKIENIIPKNVPISVRIKKEKEKAVKDLNNEKWAHDLELEVTNNGNKPFYYVMLRLILDIEDSNGKDFWANVYWGRTELGDLRNYATPEDVSIKPGESVSLKFHPAYLKKLHKMRREEGKALPTRIRVELSLLTFGDGTGYMTNNGTLYPEKSSTSGPSASRTVFRRANHSAKLSKRPNEARASLDLQHRLNNLFSESRKNFFRRMFPALDGAVNCADMPD